MPVIGITGASGFLGWHLRARLHALGGYEVRLAGRGAFADSDALAAFVRGCGTIVHLAAVNRGEEAEIERTNVELCARLAEACDRARHAPQVVFANSIHFDRDTAYGRSKRRGAALLAQWAQRSGGRFVNLVLPQVFGECGRPYYNSAVATFCHQLATGETPRVIEDRELELVHAQEAAARILELAASGQAGELRVSGRRLTVSALLARLEALSGMYNAHLIPPLADDFELSLFNTYRACRFPQGYPAALALKSDARGELFEAVRSLHGGQCFLSTTRPGVTRGNHYHLRKFERFLVVKGEAVVRVRRLFSPEAVEYRASGERPQYVDMPALHTHNITNAGSGDLITLFWAHEIFDPRRPDTYPEPVQP